VTQNYKKLEIQFLSRNSQESPKIKTNLIKQIKDKTNNLTKSKLNIRIKLPEAGAM
jgi:hypothetical protein